MGLTHFCIALCLTIIHLEYTAASTATSNVKDVNLAVSPPDMHAGFTKHLAINCTFDVSHAPNFGSLVSLIISKENTQAKGVFTDVASISSYASNQLDIKDDQGANVMGKYSSSGVSFISYEWDDPTSDVEGSYRCEALGMDQLGHPSSSLDSATIEEKMIDLGKALHTIDELRANVTNLQQQSRPSNASTSPVDCSPVINNLNLVTDQLRQCNNSTATATRDCEHEKTNMIILLNDCNKQKQNLAAEVASLKALGSNESTLLNTVIAERNSLSMSIDKCNKELQDKNLIISQNNLDTQQLNAKISQCSQEKANLSLTLQHCQTASPSLDDNLWRKAYMDTLFEPHKENYRGHQYLLSTPLAEDIARFNNICKFLNGALAEIHDDDEYDFVMHFLSHNHVSKPTTAMLGARATKHDDHWVYYSSGSRVQYTHWDDGEPDKDVDEDDCMYLYWGKEGDGMHSDDCEDDDSSRFICEIPSPIG